MLACRSKPSPGAAWDAAPFIVSDSSSLHVNPLQLLLCHCLADAIRDGSGRACLVLTNPRYPVACSKPCGAVMHDAGNPVAYLLARPPACLLACVPPPHLPTQHPMHACAGASHRWQLHQGSPSQGAAHSAQRAQLSHSCSCCVGLRGASAWAGCTAGQAVLLALQQLALAVGLRGPLRGQARQAVLMCAAAAAVVVWACALAVGLLAARSLKAITRQYCGPRGTHDPRTPKFG